MVMTLVQGTIDPDDVSWWAFLLISPLFATMFFSTRVAAVVAALAAVGATAVLVSTRAKLETNRWVAPIAFHLIFAPLLVTAAWHRLSIERKRQAELRARDAALTPQLLAFAKKQPRTPEALDLGALVKGLEPLIRRLVGSAVTVEVRPPAEAAVVIADASHMDQVVMNLVANAREAMPSGGTLTVEVQGSAKEVALTVRDTGEGMDAATQERIFEPFFTTRPGRGGTGLGLATTRSIVEQCGGIITVTSAPGAGAKFRVTLPRSTETPVAGLSRVLAARQ
jgi:C4-dicarboxylate-specific signal transduction histidine kinase